MKCSETDTKGEHKANPQNWETETNVTLLSLRAGILLFMCIIIILSLFHHFYFISIFYISSLCLVFLTLFLCLIALFDWFSLFYLYCILIFILSLHSFTNNTLLLIMYLLFWLSKSYISCHIIVVLVLL